MPSEYEEFESIPPHSGKHVNCNLSLHANCVIQHRDFSKSYLCIICVSVLSVLAICVTSQKGNQKLRTITDI